MTRALTAAGLQQSGELAVDRLPLLDALLAGASEAAGAALGALCGVPVRLIPHRPFAATAERTAEAGLHGATALFDVAEWEHPLGAVVNAAALAAVTEAMLGGEGRGAAPARPLTALDLRIADRIAGLLVDALAAAFGTLTPVTLAPRSAATAQDDGLATRLRFAALVVPVQLEIAATQHGRLDLVLPQAALAPLRARLGRPAEPARAARIDPVWASSIRETVAGTALSVRAECDGGMLTLGAMRRLAVGQILPLPDGSLSRIALDCEQERLVLCSLGQAGGQLSLVVERAGSESTGLLGTLLAAPITS